MARIILLAVLVAALGGGCSGDDDEPISRQPKPFDAEAFKDFQIVWLGPEFEGMKADGISKLGRHVVVSYGPCVEGRPGSGCATSFDIFMRTQPEPGSLADLTKFHGIPGRLERGQGNGAVLWLYSNRMRVWIDGRNRRQVIRAAGALRAVNDPPKGKPRLLFQQ